MVHHGLQSLLQTSRLDLDVLTVLGGFSLNHHHSHTAFSHFKHTLPGTSLSGPSLSDFLALACRSNGQSSFKAPQYHSLPEASLGSQVWDLGNLYLNSLSPSLCPFLDTIKAGFITLFSSSCISKSWVCAWLKETSRIGVYRVSMGMAVSLLSRR